MWRVIHLCNMLCGMLYGMLPGCVEYFGISLVVRYTIRLCGTLLSRGMLFSVVARTAVCCVARYLVWHAILSLMCHLIVSLTCHDVSYNFIGVLCC